MKKLALIFAGLAMQASAALALADVVVIAHPSVNLASADVRDLFLGDKQFAGGTKLIPVDNSAVQDDFVSKALKMDSAKYSSTWTKKSFREGLNPPPMKTSDLEVADYVKRTPGAVGYVKTAPAGVAVVTKY